MSNSKGRDFEREVHDILLNLATRFPDYVKVSSQRDFPAAVSLRPHRADFEFEYRVGALTHRHLIECQNRNRSSHEIADKIYAVRGTSNRNRYILVYKDADYLSRPVQKRLTDMGVLQFQFESFRRDFIEQLEADLALLSLGRRLISDEVLLQLLRGPVELGGSIQKGLKIEQEAVRLPPPDSALEVSQHSLNNTPQISQASSVQLPEVLVLAAAKSSVVHEPIHLRESPTVEASRRSLLDDLSSAQRHSYDRPNPADQAMISR